MNLTITLLISASLWGAEPTTKPKVPTCKPSCAKPETRTDTYKRLMDKTRGPWPDLGSLEDQVVAADTSFADKYGTTRIATTWTPASWTPASQPAIWKLRKSDDTSNCAVKIEGKHPACFVPVGMVYVARPATASYWTSSPTIVQVQTDEEIGAEQAEGMLLMARILYPALDMNKSWVVIQ